MRGQHLEIGQRLSACFSAGFNHAGSAIDHGFRVLLLVSAWLLYACGRVFILLGRMAAAGEAGLAASLRTTNAPSAQEQRRELADLIRARDADREVLRALNQKQVVPVQSLPHGTIQRWFVPTDGGWN